MKSNHQLKVILPSASPRRLQILQENGLVAVVMPANIEEIQQKDEEAKAYVTRLAKEKAQTILPQVKAGTADLILAADTTVAYQNHILEKPCDKKDAYRMLSMLSGTSHEVYTGYALIFLPEQRWWIGVSRLRTLHLVGESPTEVKDSSLVAREASWRESKTMEPSDNIFRKEYAQCTRL